MIDKDESQRRVRRSRAEIEALLVAFRKNNQSQVAFARERNLNIATFRSWLKKFRADMNTGRDRPEGFCSVTLRAGDGPFVIWLPGGIEIEVSTQVDPRWMIELLKGLQS